MTRLHFKKPSPHSPQAKIMTQRRKLHPLRLFTTLSLAGLALLACDAAPEIFDGGAGTGGNGAEPGGDGDKRGGDGDGDGDNGFGNGDGDDGSGGSSANGDGDMGTGGEFFEAPPWEYPDDVSFEYTQITRGSESCGSVEGTPESISRPIDIIFIIDNSSSMSNEIKEVEQNIAVNFADIIAASDIDYRVIMISRYGLSGGNAEDSGESDFQVCIPTPLGAGTCTAPHSEALVNSERFFHFSADIESRDSLCVLLESFDEPDEFDNQNTTDDFPAGSVYETWAPLAANGWQEWLRPGSFKTFVMMTDDNLNCNTDKFNSVVISQNFADVAFNDNGGTAAAGQAVATLFDEKLLALPGDHFGSAADRQYVFHSIIGLVENPDGATSPWTPADAITTEECADGADGPGTGYQALSILTGGLRYPICPNAGVTNFDPIFNEIALGVIETAGIPCEFAFPEVDGAINAANIKVNFTPGDGGAEIEFNRVDDSEACGAGNDFYFDDNEEPTGLLLCEGACTTVQSDDKGGLKLDFGCLGS